MKHFLTLLMAFCLTLVWSSRASVVISDTFDDGVPGTNAGTGDGVDLFENGTFGTPTLTETGGQLTITGGGSNNNAGMASKDQLSISSADTVTVHWNIASATDINFNGITLSVQKAVDVWDPGMYFVFGDDDDFKIQYRTSSNGVFAKVNAIYTTSEVLDGFTATLTADVNGWQLDTVSAGLATSYSKAPADTDYDFLDLFNNGHVVALVQGNGVATMTLNDYSVDITAVPEPGTFGLILFGGIMVLFFRRRQ